MTMLILASASPARLALLREIGLKVRVVVSNVPEKSTHAKGAAALVKHNALVKAQAVASQFKHGVIIGADTVVLAGKKVIGKPKNKLEAFKTLKLLSKIPQFVYSGLAVIDLDKKKTYLTYDKTKVYMRALTDAQIKAYVDGSGVHRFAGSFDIQGKGAVLVKRINGSYSNVVGLPIEKLKVILARISS